eukprot:3170719-Amphidinium_carterae.1
MTLWHVPAWTCSRWCTLGATSRCFTVAMLTGYESAFVGMCEDGVLGAYELTGYHKLDSMSRLLLVTTGLVAYVPETFLGAVLADNRVGLNGSEMAGEAQDEYGYLQSLPSEVWDIIALVLPDCTGAWLRHHVLQGATSAYAYLQDR